MKAFTLLLFFIQINVSTFAAVSSDKEEVQKVVQKLGMKQLTPGLIKVILRNPMSLRYIKKSAVLSDQISQKICKVEGEPRHTRDEVDAVRHFILASLLTYYVSANFTRSFLTAHEQRAAEYDSENYMDLANNELGIQFGEKMETLEMTSMLKTLTNEVLDRVQNNGELFVLDSGTSFCANSALFPTMWETN